MRRLAVLPFSYLHNISGPAVAVAFAEGAYANVRRALAAFDLSACRGRRVLIKPNVGRAIAAGTGVVTDPQAVAAAVDAFREAGAEVAIGESPILGVPTLEAFAASGVAAIAEERRCPLIDLDARPPQRIPIPGGVAVHTLQVGAEVVEYDLIVSLAVLKMHMHTSVSLSLKNMKGCLWRRSKVGFHMIPPIPGRTEKTIDIAISDMATALRPHFAIVDGYIGMEGLGPSAGRGRKADLAVAGPDALAVDAVACALIGVDPQQVVHLRLAAERGCGTLDIACLAISPADWLSRRVIFAPPPSDLSLDFPRVSVLDRNSCSACQSTLLLFLRRYGEQVFDYFPDRSALTFVIGKGNNDAAPAGAICIGNCAAQPGKRGIFVPGCPPVVSEILTAVSGKPCFDTEDGQGR
ncbi:MAG: DUF362 domain-containing protein [Planctomycetota bacterium]|nr:DUF362 domain-containing protein [Planctomycetota bacterium]